MTSLRTYELRLAQHFAQPIAIDLASNTTVTAIHHLQNQITDLRLKGRQAAHANTDFVRAEAGADLSAEAGTR